MSHIASNIDSLVRRHAAHSSEATSLPACELSNGFDGHTNLRILSVFMILLSSAFGSYFPLISSKYSFIKLPDFCFFIAKFFGSGVIIATAFIHLLQPATQELGNDCLGGGWAEYPWAFAICLITLFMLFFTEIVSHYFILNAYGDEHEQTHDHTHSVDLEKGGVLDSNDEESSSCCDVGADLHSSTQCSACDDANVTEKDKSDDVVVLTSTAVKTQPTASQTFTPEGDHIALDTNSQETANHGKPVGKAMNEKYASQIFAVMVLEFGIIFHSVFIGLTLAVSGTEFKTLFVVLIFHQMFEGLGLGTRLADTQWPEDKRLTPWLMALGFTLTTPISTAIGLGVRKSFVPGSRKALISSGLFDSISSGILIYTGLVELMAHEFLYSNQFKGPGGFKRMILAYICMCFGTGLMALLGKWA